MIAGTLAAKAIVAGLLTEAGRKGAGEWLHSLRTHPFSASGSMPLCDLHRSEMKGELWQKKPGTARISGCVLLWCLLAVFEGLDRGGGEAFLDVAAGECGGAGGVLGNDEVEDLC